MSDDMFYARVCAERDQLRAELAAAKAKMQEGEGDCRFCRDLEGDSKYPCTCGLTYGALATAYGNALQERTALCAELAAAKNLLARIHRDGGHHTEAVGFSQSVADAGDKVSEWLLVAKERTALAAHVERLEKALKPFADRIKQYPPWMWTAMVEREKQGIITGGFRVGGEAVTHMPAMLLVQAEEALAATPAQSLAAHDAALLREVADGVNKIAVVGAIDTPQSIRDLIADAIRAKADRTEKVAPEVYDVWKEVPHA